VSENDDEGTDATAPGTETPPSKAEPPGSHSPTARDPSLHRQQAFVATGVADLSGLAVVVAVTQRFPDLPFILAPVLGTATTGLLLALLSASVFGREDD
jgi:membrane glycosyltransferase